MGSRIDYAHSGHRRRRGLYYREGVAKGVGGAGRAGYEPPLMSGMIRSQGVFSLEKGVILKTRHGGTSNLGPLSALHRHGGEKYPSTIRRRRERLAQELPVRTQRSQAADRSRRSGNRACFNEELANTSIRASGLVFSGPVLIKSGSSGQRGAFSAIACAALPGARRPKNLQGRHEFFSR